MGRLSGTAAVLGEYTPCPATGLATINLRASEDGARITVRDVLVDAFGAIDSVMVAHDYVIEKHHTGAFACRNITGGNGFSLHASGAATDYNWQRNPFGKRLVTDMPAAMVSDILNITTNDGVKVFRWGGHYTKNKDAMHYEVLADRRSIATGINPGSVAGVGFKPTGGKAPATASTKAVLRLTDPRTRGDDVKELQRMLKECAGHDDIEIDGFFGPKTAAHVSLYQSVPAHGLVQDGVAGPATLASLHKACG